MAHILVVDGEKNIRITVSTILRQAGLNVETAEDSDVAIELLATRNFDVVLSDIALASVNSAELLKSIRKASPNVQVILMTDPSNVDSESDVVKASAFDYVKKPITKAKLIRVARNAVRIKTLDDERRRLQEENLKCQKNLEDLITVRIKSLAESDERSKTLLKTIPDMMFTIDTEHVFKSHHTSKASDLFAPPEDFVGKKVEDILPPHLAKVTVESVDKVINSQQVNWFEYSLEIENELRYFESLMIPKDKNEVLAVIREITDTRETLERLEILFESAPDAFYINDMLGNFLDGNKVAEKILGYKKEELIGKNFLQLKLLRLKDLPKAAKNLAKNVLGEGTGPDEFTLYNKDGDLVHLEIMTHPVKISNKKVVLGIARDISKRVEAEAALRGNEKRFSRLSDLSFEGIIIHKNGIVLEVNSTLLRMTGYSTEELTGKNFVELVIPQDYYEIISKMIQKDFSAPYEIEGIRKDGVIFPLEIESRSIDYNNEDGVRVTALRDISRRAKIEM